MAGVRFIIGALALAFAVQVAAYALNLDVLTAWPSPCAWFALLIVATVATIVAAWRPSSTAVSVAGMTTATVYALRIAELLYALLWGRLSMMPDAVRATGWVALTRDVTALVALLGLWFGVMLTVVDLEGSAREPVCEPPRSYCV